MTTKTENETFLTASLLNVCKLLLGRVRLLEEVVQGHPELRERFEEQARFRAAFEEDEYQKLVSELQEWLEVLEDEMGSE